MTVRLSYSTVGCPSPYITVTVDPRLTDLDLTDFGCNGHSIAEFQIYLFFTLKLKKVIL